MKRKSLEYYMSLNYPIELLQLDEEDGGGYMATIPELGKDAFIGDGDTIQEALEDLEDTKEMLFKDYIEEGIEIPLPSKDEDFSGKFVLRLPVFLHRQIAEQARSNNVSLNTYCLALLSQGNALNRIDKSLKSMSFALQSIRKEFSSTRYNVLPKQVYGGAARYTANIVDLKEVANAKAS